MNPSDKPDKQYTTVHIPLSEIFVDYTFNSRGIVMPYDVGDLVDSLKQSDLQTPVSVEPYSDPDHPNYKYRLIAGFRRHMAFKVLERPTIPAFIVEGLDEDHAREYNIVENINRQQLNMVQEANALQYYFDKGYTDEMLAQKFSQSVHWVRMRRVITRMDYDVQMCVAAGIIKTYQQIMAFDRMTHDKQCEIIRAIKDRNFRTEMLGVKMRGEKSKYIINKNLAKAKPPEPKAIERLKDAIYMGVGPCLATRLLAWAEGNISEQVVWKEVIEWCNNEGYTIDIPQEIRIALGMSFDETAAAA